MFDETTPYTVLVEDNELKVEPRYYAEHWQGREAHLRRIQELVGLDDRRLLTCHGHQVFSSTVLASLKRRLHGAPRLGLPGPAGRGPVRVLLVQLLASEVAGHPHRSSGNPW